jgi:hypothetical protein
MRDTNVKNLIHMINGVNNVSISKEKIIMSHFLIHYVYAIAPNLFFQ